MFLFPARNKKRGLVFRLSLFILTSTMLIFLVAFGYNYIYARKLVLKNVEENAKHLTQATVNKVEITLRSIEKGPQYLATSLERFDYDQEGLAAQIKNMLDVHKDVFGSTIAFEPYAFSPTKLYFAPYYYRDGGNLKFVNLGDNSYRYFYWDWYQIPKELAKPIWSEPYFDEGGGRIIMTTYSIPFYRQVKGKRMLSGIVTADISLDWLVRIVSGISIYKSGYAFVISQNGVFVSHPDKNLFMRDSIFGLAEEHHDEKLRNIGREMIQGKSGFVPVRSYFADSDAWLYYAPLPSVGWSIGIIIPEKELFADIHKLGQIVTIIVVIGCIILFLVSISIARKIASPINALALKAREISKGDLNVVLPTVDTNDEVKELTSSFDNMRLALKDYIMHLKETTAAKERIESELKIAHSIQMNFLPKKFPPFPEHKEFEIFADLQPAREVGGDLYDFFLIDDSHLFFTIGDVSGKGVPAALFMAVTITLMKGISKQKIDPAEILNLVNRELCRENEAMMFVTLFCGILDIHTGEVVYSNAGHNPPLICHAGALPEFLHLPSGLVLGAMDDSVYEKKSVFLKPGDMLVLYTDGVIEAMNPEQVPYSENRLIGGLTEAGALSADKVAVKIIDSVKQFTGTAPQSDDITMLILRYRG